MDNKTKGVVLISGGHPMYSHYAANLAMSIRDHSDIPIVLFYEGAGLSYLFQDQKDLFTDILELPIEYYMTTDGARYVKAKLHLYDLSPFDETLFLDVDMIFSDTRISGKKIEDLFKENEMREIQFACRGEKKMDEGIRSEWVNLSEVKNIHGFDHWYELSSEFIYFKKGETAQKVFDTALNYYDNPGMEIKRWIVENGRPKLEEKPNAIAEFAGGIPDEVPFSFALEKLGVKIKAPYLPSYWQPFYFAKTIPDVEVQRRFPLVSIGGAALQPNTQRIYNTLAKYYAGKTLHKRSPYQAVAKKEVLNKERRFI